MSKVIFDGVGEQPELNRITAKKNYASSSQSHKMGATAMFNDILHYLAKEKYPNLLNEVGGNVAVRQHPVYAFEKTLIEGTTDQYNRKFIGLYTVGADKGDKGYFGFTDERIKDKAIRLEGTDHLKGVGFNYPWEVNGVKNIRYNHDKKALCIVTGYDPTKWTTLFEQSYCGTAKTEAEIEAYLEAKFKTAYDCAYYNNPLLVGTDMTLEQINADTEAFGNLRRSDFRPYSQCEFWIDGEYDVYYLNKERGVFEKNGINILTDLGISESSLDGLSIEEKNDKFVEARVARFKSEASEHYCIDDAIYQLMFLYIIVATDNFEKNMYPYLMDSLWRFFQDDLDSIFSTDNQGQDTKKYSAELHDFTDDRKAAYVFKGEDSALWQLIERAYPNECKKMGRDILQAMYEMATSGTTTVERLMSFFDDYFFSRAQNYFTPSAYNNDTEYAYEEAWNNKEYVASVDIHPLAQALGSHETTERAWLEKRIIYLMSKFGFGGYASASDTSLGIISVRTQVEQSFTLTPAIDSYPTMLGGQSQVVSAENRVMAGESVELKEVGEGNTNIYFVGADWLSDIGDLKDIKIDPSSDVKLSVSSKRLRRLKVGDKTQEVTSYLPKLEVMRCDSLESVDARRLASLVGTVDLSQCPRLIEAFFGGTNVDGVKIAKGSKIERLQLPDSVYSLDLQDVKFLETFELGTVGNLAFLRIENVPSVNGFAVLKSAYNTDGQRLKDIRLIGFTYNGDANDVTMLSNIASDKDKDGNEHEYNGIDSNGVPNTSNPELQGTLNISGGVYEEDINKVLPEFPSLTINYDPSKLYMPFADPEVLRVLLANMTTDDNIGITEAQAKAVTTISTWFKGNTAIESFKELDSFNNVKILYTNAFRKCTSLKTISLKNITEVQQGCFYESSLEGDIVAPALLKVKEKSFRGTNITSVYAPLLTSTSGDFFEDYSSQGSFAFCKQLESVDSPMVTTLGKESFRECSSLSNINIPNVRVLGIDAFYKCTSLKTIAIQQVESIGAGCFWGCSALSGDLVFPSLTTLGTKAFRDTNISSFDAPILQEINGSGPHNGYVYGTFRDCKQLKSVNAPSVTSLVLEEFINCSELTNVVLDWENVTKIGDRSFYGCTSLEVDDLNLPNLETLGQNAFYGVKIKKMVLGSDDVTLTLPAASTATQNYGDKSVLEEIELHGVESIPAISFYGYSSLVKCNLSKSVTKVDTDAFYNTALSDIDLSNIQTFGRNSFAKTKLKQAILTSYVSGVDSTSYYQGVFSYCTALELVDVGENATHIPRDFVSGCTSLHTIIIRATEPPTLHGEGIRGVSALTAIYVPDESYEAYCESWTEYAGRIKKMSEYVEQ